MRGDRSRRGRAGRGPAPIARTVGNCLSMGNYARLAQALGAARLKALMFTTRALEAEEAIAIGFAITDDLEALCERLASYAPATLRVTKEALRRARLVPEGDELVLEAYGAEAFRTNVRRFLSKESG